MKMATNEKIVSSSNLKAVPEDKTEDKTQNQRVCFYTFGQLQTQNNFIR
jgi:hypothetical protein